MNSVASYILVASVVMIVVSIFTLSHPTVEMFSRQGAWLMFGVGIVGLLGLVGSATLFLSGVVVE